MLEGVFDKDSTSALHPVRKFECEPICCGEYLDHNVLGVVELAVEYHEGP